MAGKIFISYRRSETACAARALFERLRREFDDRVFIDIEGLSLGIDYTKVIDAHLADCEVMLALIGHDWLQEIERRARIVATASSAGGDDDDNEPDWVRVELTRALVRGIPVVPVLIEDALLPAKKDLPAELKGLRNRNGMEVHARFFDDQTGRLVREIAKIIVAPSPAQVVVLVRQSWMSNLGADKFGRWAEFEVKGAGQRMRWIAPGEFWMGSPETESGHKSSEQRHPVTHTLGFWLADTACTQTLWQAVMDDNPSHFTGDLLCPVEQVSWDLIQQDFLPKLNRLVPGLSVALPTEAQWEYSCRAGTQTPFSFGEDITAAQVNFDGNKRHKGGPQGLYRRRTVPVKSLPPNAWGLYEMHGNVWEWCADSYEPYNTDHAVDPASLVTDAISRVCRGGCWSLGPPEVRAACRGFNGPEFCSKFLGFRVCSSSRYPTLHLMP
jgi:formylglycine-generating enzyme required for sulfatase activity